MQKAFVCLAKSAREGGLCIAGKEMTLDLAGNWYVGGWFRPTGTIAEALPAEDCTFNIGDVVACVVSGPAPCPTQPENWRLAPNPEWRVIGVFSGRHKHLLVDEPEVLWNTGCSSTHGENDRVPLDAASAGGGSLHFIRIEEGILTKNDESHGDRSKVRLRLEFAYRHQYYAFAVTDPAFCRRWWDRLRTGESTPVGPCFLTISLARPYHNYCYKLVAGHVAI